MRSYQSEFAAHITESKNYLLQALATSPSKQRDKFSLAVDAYGDARKVIEEFETDWLRERFPATEQEYTETRSQMIQICTDAHCSLQTFATSYLGIGRNGQVRSTTDGARI